MSKVIVSKFGGSSLADSKQFNKVKEIVLSNKNRRYIVPSAPGKRHEKDYKMTDLLYLCQQHVEQGVPFDEVYKIIEKRYIDICLELGLTLDMKTILNEIKDNITAGASADYAASRGEYLNGLILASLLKYEFIDASELIIFSENGQFDSEATQKRVNQTLKSIEKAVIPGFYGAMESGQIKTFSRGGSDVTGAIIARGVGAHLYENWTDVSGFCMADPRIVENPQYIKKITYRELRELSYMGASVLHEEAIFPVKRESIPIRIKNTNAPEDVGTLIVDDLSPVNYTRTITGIAGKKDFTVIAIEKMLMNAEKGFIHKLLTILEANGISAEHMPSSIDSISLVISDKGLKNNIQKVINEIRVQTNPDSIVAYPNMALIAVVGRGMIKTKGISAKVFGALAKEGINVRMITQGSSELNIIVGIENSDFERGISVLYKVFQKKEA
ncbi:aspartate kinase [Alkaliphilus metalliredigens QYMF]|uniref:Aspartokinase n=1 Tax=Alkaliphilus metalliredigens (strain QYMF) TaxID=293826 RepID=A6TTL7_ALKMQ|nr:aspartate kinase [Alkaliphilus metalliredigens]ABR49535.1 aspartate kinase [Alkaliphilus metalliredigens QYMF]